ncbi:MULTISPECIES: LysE family translocator [unclassified Pseudodesulfovibrio]|uniref:LysE family translocator n=1 Tax=unclassified Pseudodesulfovibrio TaxID=2661612 RepID=UPI000FEB8D3C|nr:MULTISPECIES: LysE family translocator [unclassified Pseudodesulfovibrio]MCJ2165527.1 LysE family translocator [Pseudodesulfovibrio sp. S3-i]RWU03111.1 LysE family translocator [Pseudodesulfovibrio sp. S3]
MVGILLYCVAVMYTPGPVNILSLNCGVQRRFAAHIPFCLGVAVALSFWFLLMGYAGSAVVDEKAMPLITAFGVSFILYLAYRVISSDVDTARDGNNAAVLKFSDGLLMQLLNPKSFLAVLPVTAVQFPAAGIGGSGIAVWSIGLGLLGFGAPLAYAAFGSAVARHVENSCFLKYFNVVMGVTLAVVALDMAYQHIYLALR